MRLGVMLPLTDLGGEPNVLRDFALAAEELGYTNLGLPDHVLGANAATHPEVAGRNTSADMFHDPFVAFGFLAGLCKPTTEFSTQVLILAQRQAVLVAKQAACLDVLCGGRFRLGVGVGWNEVEYVGLNENFHNRGRRSEEQVQVMQKLWAQPHVKYEGRWHHIDDAGINPRPASGKVPVWYGGHVEQTLQRCAKWGDGWMPNAYPPGQEALDIFAKLRKLTEEAGRNPKDVGIEVWTSMGSGSEADWAREAGFWKKAGATHLCLTTTFHRRHHHRLAGKTVMVAAMKGRRQAQMRRPGLLPKPGFPSPICLAARAHRSPHLDPDILGVTAGFLGQLAQLGENIERLLARRIGVGHPAVAPFGAALQGLLDMAAIPHRHFSRSRARIDPGIVDMVPAALILYMRLGPQFLHHLHLLLGAAAAIVEILVEADIFDLVPADPDTKPEPPAA